MSAQIAEIISRLVAVENQNDVLARWLADAHDRIEQLEDRIATLSAVQAALSQRVAETVRSDRKPRYEAAPPSPVPVAVLDALAERRQNRRLKRDAKQMDPATAARWAALRFA